MASYALQLDIQKKNMLHPPLNSVPNPGVQIL